VVMVSMPQVMPFAQAARFRGRLAFEMLWEPALTGSRSWPLSSLKIQKN
jgi:hypothetical protein